MRRLTFLISLLVFSQAIALEVSVTVRESAGVGAQSFPVTVVIPLADGQYTSTSAFGILDAQDNPVPAQFEVLERDWIEDGSPHDNSILHVAAHFQATVGPAGTAPYTFTDSGNTPPTEAASVSDSGGYYTVTTGPLRFTVNKTGFNILDTVWYDADGDGSYENAGGSVKGDERIIKPSSEHGGRFDGCTGVSAGSCTREWQHDTGLTPDTTTIEESGPLRVVLRVERHTDYRGVDDHEHGYVVRIFAYAGKPFIKVDYQLINAAAGPNLDGGKFANPLYFNSLNLEWNLELEDPVTVRTSTASDGVDVRQLDANGVEFAYTMHDRYAIRHADVSPQYDSCDDGATNSTNDCDTAGFMDVSDGTWGVQAVVRNMWELWPSGLEVTDSTDHTLQVQLWPDWSSQWNYASKSLSGTGLYWLDDMRAVYKEVLLNFHGSTPGDSVLTGTARTFDRSPVPVVGLDQYKAAGVTWDGENKTALAAYHDTGSRLEGNDGILDENSEGSYRMGWARWSIASVDRLLTPHSTGSSPASGEWFLYTGSPSTFWESERQAIAELNARPQWMGSDYTHAGNWSAIQLTQAPYGGGNWRAQGDSSTHRIPGTGDENKAMDDAHFWAYHLMDYYWYSGNPWVRDWLRFLGEFRRPRLLRVELYPAEEDRDIAHALAGVIQAYRATGDATLMIQYEDYIGTYLHGKLNAKCGHLNGSIGSANPIAFKTRVLQNSLRYLEGNDWEAWGKVFAYVSAHIEWNLYYGRYGYHVNEQTGSLVNCTVNSSWGGGAAWNLPDVNSWYYWNTGKVRFKLDNDNYTSHDDNSGGPYTGSTGFPQPAWDGGWAGRYYWFENEATRNDATPPSAISSLTASANGNTLSLAWTPPGDASYYLIVWSDRMLEECTSNCANDPQATNTANYRNWWAAEAYGCDANSCNGSTVIDTTGTTPPTHFAIFAFDGADNMSAMSNVAVVASGPLEAPPPPSGLRVDP